MPFAARKNKKQNGFTLPEVLVVVALIAVLLTFGVAILIQSMRRLKLRALDTDAETIFMAAQDRLTAMANAGELDQLANGPTVNVNYDNAEDNADDVSGSFLTLVYLDSTASAADVDLANILPPGSIESELRAGHYVIEYSHRTGTVYGVWYTDKTGFDYNPGDRWPEEFDERMKKSPLVGFYGGSAVDRPGASTLPIPRVTLLNAEVLRLRVEEGALGDLLPAGSTADVTVHVGLREADTAERDNYLWLELTNPLKMNSGTEAVGDVILDAVDPTAAQTYLTTAGATLLGCKQFREWVNYTTPKTVAVNGGTADSYAFDAAAGSVKVRPGSDITVAVWLEYTDGDRICQSEQVFVNGNSLFGAVVEDETTHALTAQLTYGRHLQNLRAYAPGAGAADAFVSALDPELKLTGAELIRDLDFAAEANPSAGEDPARFWQSCYGKDGGSLPHLFAPIYANADSSDALMTFDGHGLAIKHMNVNAGGAEHAGLFGVVGAGRKVENLNLVDGHALNAESAGTLAAEADGAAFINCRVYLEDGTPGDGDPTNVTDALVTVTGGGSANAGGLVGQAAGCTFTSCSAATTVDGGTGSAGGLVGSFTGTASDLQYCHAASHILNGGTVGGLAGSGNAKLTDCYAAGYIANAATAAAGLLNSSGTLNGANYAAVRYGGDLIDKAKEPTPSVMIYGTTRDPASTALYVRQNDATYAKFSAGSYGKEVSTDELKKLAGNKDSSADFTTSVWFQPTETSGTGTDLIKRNPTYAVFPYQYIKTVTSPENDLTAPYPYPQLAMTVGAEEQLLPPSESGTETVPMVHHGDWLESTSELPELHLAYVEQYTGAITTGGWYAATMDEDGNLTASDNLSHSTANAESAPGDRVYAAESYYYIISPTELTGGMLNYKLDGNERPSAAGDLYTLEEVGSGDSDYVVLSSYPHLYKIAMPTGTGYYHTLEMGSGDDARSFLFNLDYACEAIDVTAKVKADTDYLTTVVPTLLPQVKPGSAGSSKESAVYGGAIIVRTADQLETVGTATQAAAAAADGSGRKRIYAQTINIDLKGKPHTPIFFDGGSYYGNEYAIANMEPTPVTDGNDVLNGLFASVTTSDTTNVVLDGIRLINPNVIISEANMTGLSNTGDTRTRAGALAARITLPTKDPSVLGAITVNDCGAFIEAATSEAYDTLYTNDSGVKNTLPLVNRTEKDSKGKKSQKTSSDYVGGLLGSVSASLDTKKYTVGSITIQNSFASVKVTGVRQAGGFAGLLDSVTVQDCYAGGHTRYGAYPSGDANVTAVGGDARAQNSDSDAQTDVRVYVGGFAGILECDNNKVSNLQLNGVIYSTCSVKAGGTNKGSRGGYIVGNVDKKDNDPWSWNYFKADFYGTGILTVPSYTDDDKVIQQTTEDEVNFVNNNITLRAPTNTEGVPYDQTLYVTDDAGVTSANYPFLTPASQTRHHGDWPHRFDLVYYEVYKEGDPAHPIGDSATNPKSPAKMMVPDPDDPSKMVERYVGLYGVLNDDKDPNGRVVNTLSTTGLVIDSGYMVLAQEGTGDIVFTLHSDYYDNTSSGKVSKDKTNSETLSMKNRSELPKAWQGDDLCRVKYAYIISYETLSIPPDNKFYMKATINGQAALLNPHFPCEAVNIHLLNAGETALDQDTVRTKPELSYLTYPYDPETDTFDTASVTKEVDTNSVVLRSALHVASMARYTREGNMSDMRVTARSYTFELALDADFAAYTQGAITDGLSAHKDSDGKYWAGQKPAYGMVGARLDGGKFDGNGHAISNLFLGYDVNDTTRIGLFNLVNNGTVLNVRLVNVQANNEAHSNGTLYAGILAGELTGSTTVQNVVITDPFLHIADNGHTEDKNGKATSDGGSNASIGAVVGHVTGDVTLENASANMSTAALYEDGKHGVLSQDDKDTAAGDSAVGGFAGYLGKGVTVKNSYAAVPVTGCVYVGGFAGRITGASLENCYAGGHTRSRAYSTTTANVTATAGDNTAGDNTARAGGFAALMQVAYNSGTSGAFAMEMKGVNYSTCSVKANGGTVGLFAAEFTDQAARDLVAKYPYPANIMYGTGIPLGTGTLHAESGYALTGARLPAALQNDPAKQVTAEPYDALGDTYPYQTGQSMHHGDWAMPYYYTGALYWERETDAAGSDAVFRVHYIAGNESFPALDEGSTGLCTAVDGRIVTAGYAVFAPAAGGTLPTLDSASRAGDNADIINELKTFLGQGYQFALYACTSGGTLQTSALPSKDAVSWVYLKLGFADTLNTDGDTVDALGAAAGTPLQVRTTGQLASIGTASGKYYKQTHDILPVVKGSTYTLDGAYTPPTLDNAQYNGNGYRVLDLPSNVFAGVTGGAVADGVVLYSPTGKGEISGANAGGITAVLNGGTLQNCVVAGYTITGTGTGNAGGLAGSVTGSGNSILNSEATATLSAPSGNAGGLAGNAVGLTVSNSYAGGSVTDADSAGGLVGYGSGVTYKDVYSYVEMLDLDDSNKATTLYGIGPGTVDAGSALAEYWAGGLPDEPNVTNINGMTGVPLTALKDDTKHTYTQPANEVYRPDKTADDAARANGLANKVAPAAKDDFTRFPFAAFVQSGADADRHVHYGGLPDVQPAGIFYHETEAGQLHFYVYGVEIVTAADGTMKAGAPQLLADTLCYDHHLGDGKVNRISDTGYGVYWPGNVDEPTLSIGSKKVELQPGGDLLNGLVELLSTTDEQTLNVRTVADGDLTYDPVQWQMSIARSGGFSYSLETEVSGAYAAAITLPDSPAGKDIGQDATIPAYVRTIQQFQAITAGLNSTSSKNIEYVVLTHDVDGAALTTPYKPSQANVASINGQGYRILGLNITADDAALFTLLKNDENSVLKNLILYDPEGDGTITGTNNAAGLVATLGNGTIENCAVAGYTIKGGNYVGGIAGLMNDNTKAVIKNCQAVVDLKLADGTSTGTSAGGIAGKGRGSISDCYAGGSITGKWTKAGGLYGEGQSSNITVSNSYSFMKLLDVDGTVYALGEASTDPANCSYLADELSYLPAGCVKEHQGTGYANVGAFIEKLSAGETEYTFIPKAGDAAKGLTPSTRKYVLPTVVTVTLKRGKDSGVDADANVDVHYGDWLRAAAKAGVMYWEIYSDDSFGCQVAGIDGEGHALASLDTLCTDRHMNDDGTIDTSMHTIKQTGYALFNGDTEVLTLSADALTPYDTAGLPGNNETVKTQLYAMLGGNPDVIEIYETTTYDAVPHFTAEIDGSSNLIGSITVSGTDSKADLGTCYYSNGFAGVSSAADFGTTASNPLQVRTLRQLQNTPDSIDCGTSSNKTTVYLTTGKFFKQSHDMNGEDYTGYVGPTNFRGNYDGDYYHILELSIESNGARVGLFSTVGGTLQNIILYSPSGDGTITATLETQHTTTGGSNPTPQWDRNPPNVGGLVGATTSQGAARIENCVVAGYTITGSNAVGGLVGSMYQGGTIKNCVAVNNLMCKDTYGSVFDKGINTHIGGLVGTADSNGSSFQVHITDCYVGGTAKSENGEKICSVGGILGFDFEGHETESTATTDNAYIRDSYTYLDAKGITAEYYYAMGRNLTEDRTGSLGSYGNAYWAGGWDTASITISNPNFAKNQGIDVGTPGTLPDGTTDHVVYSYVPEGAAAGGTVTGKGLTPQEKDGGNSYPFAAKLKGLKQTTETDGEGNKTYTYAEAYVHYGMWPDTSAPAGDPAGEQPGMFSMGMEGPDFEGSMPPDGELTDGDVTEDDPATDPEADPNATPTPSPTPDPDATPTPTPDPNASPTPEPEASPEPTPAPEPTPEATPETTPEATPEVTPEATPAEPTPEVTPADTPPGEPGPDSDLAPSL